MLAQSLHWRGVFKRNDSVLQTSKAVLDTFKYNGVLETSEAALDAFSKMTVLDGHLGGGFLRKHDFSGETKNCLEP